MASKQATTFQLPNTSLALSSDDIVKSVTSSGTNVTAYVGGNGVSGNNDNYYQPAWIQSILQMKLYAKDVPGSDPRAQTCRGKLQNTRSKLNQEINKELMLRAGAERLFKATTNKKLRATVALELSFVNSNLQLLKAQLADLNSSVDIYQNGENSPSLAVPMIPLGLKETKDIDFVEPFKDFILEHYSENAGHFDDALTELMDLRQAMRTPTREQSGTSLLFRYYNHLHFVERRFFSSDRNLGVFFEWYDSLTGVPSCQKTIAFEKASILFNIAALYTQIGARQDRNKGSGIDDSVDSFLRAASMFHFIHNNFSNAPSMDLRPETLNMLVNLMLAQARECIFEKLVITGPEKKNIEACLEAGQEAAQVAEAYSRVHALISEVPVKDYVPYSWISLVLVKREHYKALSHYYVALGFLDHTELGPAVSDMLQCIQISDPSRTNLIDIKVPRNDEQRLLLGRCHLKESLLLHEESLRVHRLCRHLRKVDSLKEKLRKAHDRALNKYADIEEEDDFQEVPDPPQIQASTKYQLNLTSPDFSQHRIQDLFHDLGPLAIFSARHHWTAPRTVHLRKETDEASYGFSVRGDSPAIVAAVDKGSLADSAGLKEGDFIVAIDEVDTKWFKHEDVVTLIRKADDGLRMKLVTPVDRHYLRIQPRETSNSPTSSSSGISCVSSGLAERISPTGSWTSIKSKDSNGMTHHNSNSYKRLTWNPFKKNLFKDKHDEPVVFSKVPSR